MFTFFNAMTACTGHDQTLLMPNITLFETNINSVHYFEKCKLNKDEYRKINWKLHMHLWPCVYSYLLKFYMYPIKMKN